eukprot:Nitzschia sp. Nitz4//NODE_367_length_23738_cov_71.755985//22239//23337//NITZ4_additional_000047-RA//-1//CDS//3329531864//201//frame0
MERAGSREELSRQQAILSGIPYIVTKQFPWRLHEMLEQSEREGYEHIVSWVSGGRAFKVHRPDTFVKDIMKLHFQQTKYKSFQRQLNLWGFERSTKEAFERGSYFHPLFIRGRKELCQNMERHRVKQSTSTTRSTSNASTRGDEKPPSLTSSSEATSQSGSVESDNKPSPPSSSPQNQGASDSSSEPTTSTWPARNVVIAQGQEPNNGNRTPSASPHHGALHQTLSTNNVSMFNMLNRVSAPVQVPVPAPATTLSNLSNPLAGALPHNPASLLFSGLQSAQPIVQANVPAAQLPVQLTSLPSADPTQARQVRASLDALLASLLSPQQRYNGGSNGGQA